MKTRGRFHIVILNFKQRNNVRMMLHNAKKCVVHCVVVLHLFYLMLECYCSLIVAVLAMEVLLVIT